MDLEGQAEAITFFFRKSEQSVICFIYLFIYYYYYFVIDDAMLSRMADNLSLLARKIKVKVF
jgi:hypothetical protein